MKPYVGFWDALFGERVTFELPTPSGGVKKVQVTKKWLEKMKREGRIKDVTSEIVSVNILDPVGVLLYSQADDYRIEHWKIGEQISKENYEKFLDPKTKELYAFADHRKDRLKDGKLEGLGISLTSRDLWKRALDEIQKI